MCRRAAWVQFQRLLTEAKRANILLRGTKCKPVIVGCRFCRVPNGQRDMQILGDKTFTLLLVTCQIFNPANLSRLGVVRRLTLGLKTIGEIKISSTRLRKRFWVKARSEFPREKFPLFLCHFSRHNYEKPFFCSSRMHLQYILYTQQQPKQKR